MSNHKIKYYPVGNGDMSLITLKSKKTILIDCNIRESSSDEIDDPKEVKEDLLNSIQKRNNKPFIDVFALTHPDKDHCGGFDKNFYTGDPDDYSDENEDNEEIIIDELWVTRRVFRDDLSNEASPIKNEANRRKRLYQNNDSKKNKAGNRLRIVGHDDNDDRKEVPHYIPGDEIDEINNEIQEDFSVFIHAPFKKTLIIEEADKDNPDRNSTSIIFQARFFENKDGKEKSDFICRALFGGDADHYRWKEVLNKSKKKNNEESLKWDIFLVPHHCSWTFFNDTPYTDEEENQTPKDYSLQFLDYKLPEAKVIASSIKIKDEKPNPPHQPAKDEYIKKVGEKNFLNTATKPNEKKPKPIEFIITKKGFALSPLGKIGSTIVSGGGAGAAGTVVKTG
ncbi:MAG: cobyric acid synthase CobQ [Cytophagales bacterium]|nr:cobyric acid synthase CobQ [Cytophagales bacterium]